MSAMLLSRLRRGLESMGLPADKMPLSAYLAYMDLLAQWNSAYNLTAVRSAERMLACHILDSLSILPFIDDDGDAQGQCLDVGTGAGLPGIILALAKADTRWVLLDGNRKKIRFVTHAALILNADNVQVVYSRIEDYAPGMVFSTIVSRALSSAADFFRDSHHLLAPRGQLLAMKGAMAEQEMNDLQGYLRSGGFAVAVDVIPLKVPYVRGRRNLLRITKKC